MSYLQYIQDLQTSDSNRKVFASIPHNSINKPLLIWFNTYKRNMCYYSTMWWSTQTEYNKCNSSKSSENGDYWLIDFFKKIESDVSILIINPEKNGIWNIKYNTWSSSNDRTFVKDVITTFISNNSVDITNVFLGGWYTGANMVSRMFNEVKLDKAYDNINIKGGIMISGGSYSGIQDCNNTEEYYDVNKTTYKDHPICFLSQFTNDDNTESKSYFCTLKKNIQNHNFSCYKQEYEIPINSITGTTNYMIHLNSKIPSNFCKPTDKDWKKFNNHWNCDDKLCFDKRLVYPIRNFILVNSVGYYSTDVEEYNYKNDKYDTELMVALSIGIGLPFIAILLYILSKMNK